MGKDYDTYVTPQNTPRYKERRILFLLAMGLLIANMIIFAILYSAVRGALFALAAVMGVFTVVHCLDNRKAMWSWGYIITWCILDLLLSLGLVLGIGAYWYLSTLSAEFILYCICAFLILKKRKRK